MPIYDQSFRRYEGDRHASGLWRVVAWNTFRPVLRSKIAGLLLIGAIIHLSAYSMGLFFGAKMGEFDPKMAEQAAQAAREQQIPLFGGSSGLNTILFDFLLRETGLIWLLLLVTGGGSVSSDLRNAALPLYFARPLRPRDYILGKFVGLALAPAVVVSVAVLLIYLQVIAYHFPASALLGQAGLLLRAVGYAVLTSAFVALLMVAFSSASRKASTAAVTFLGFFMIAQVVARIAERGFRYRQAGTISPALDLHILLVKLFNPDFDRAPRQQVRFEQYDVRFAVMALVAYALLALFLIRRNLRVVEVVK